MPVVVPPNAGFLGKSRRRVSASGLVTWERCPRQWHYRRRIGLSDPISPEMIVGLVVEDALCGVLMERLSQIGEVMEGRSSWVEFSRDSDGLERGSANGEVVIDDFESVTHWLESVIPSVVDEVLRILQQRWDSIPWLAAGRDISEITAERIENLLRGGIQLQLEEVAKCLAAGGGPLLAEFRAGGDPFAVPAPCWDEAPCLPGSTSDRAAVAGFQSEGEVTIWEVWEIARPWVKDHRVSEPQRLFHPEGWAAGEMDLVVRWDGSVRICDIKSSAGTSGYSAGLASQLQFYQWLWGVTRGSEGRPEGRVLEGDIVGLEGWYLLGPHRKQVDLLSSAELTECETAWKEIHDEMIAGGLHPTEMAPADPSPWVTHASGGTALPIADEVRAKAKTCERCTGAAFCDAAPKSAVDKALNRIIPPQFATVDALREALRPKPPCGLIRDIPRRINVRGKLAGHWGPLANHFGEQVRGATVVVGNATVVVEEMGADSFGEIPEGDKFALLNVAPGLWRGMPRLYLDEHSSVLQADEAEQFDFTRLGLIPTKASLSGLVVSRNTSSGVNAQGKQWTMETCHIWDGNEVIEVVAFGRSIGKSFQDLRVGDRARILSAELGWRDGVPQLRVDNRQTRLEVTKSES